MTQGWRLDCGVVCVDARVARAAGPRGPRRPSVSASPRMEPAALLGSMAGSGAEGVSPPGGGHRCGPIACALLQWIGGQAGHLASSRLVGSGDAAGTGIRSGDRRRRPQGWADRGCRPGCPWTGRDRQGMETEQSDATLANISSDARLLETCSAGLCFQERPGVPPRRSATALFGSPGARHAAGQGRSALLARSESGSDLQAGGLSLPGIDRVEGFRLGSPGFPASDTSSQPAHRRGGPPHRSAGEDDPLLLR